MYTYQPFNIGVEIIIKSQNKIRQRLYYIINVLKMSAEILII